MDSSFEDNSNDFRVEFTSGLGELRNTLVLLKTYLTEQLKLIMSCNVNDLLSTTLTIFMRDIQVTILTNGGVTALNGEDELRMVPWMNMEDVGP